jgi:hypothetical protein
LFRKTNDREKQNLINERERQNTAIRTFENDLNEMKIRENNLTNEIRDKTSLEERIETLKKEIVSLTATSKARLFFPVINVRYLIAKHRIWIPKFPKRKFRLIF